MRGGGRFKREEARVAGKRRGEGGVGDGRWETAAEKDKMSRVFLVGFYIRNRTKLKFWFGSVQFSVFTNYAHT